MDIEGLKKLAEAATPGPWHVYDADGSIGTIEDSAGAALAQAQMRGSLRAPNNIERKANAAFIAAANPQTVLALIRELEEARKDAARYQWLRNKANFARSSDPMVCANPLGKQELIDGERLDSAIDAAREKQ